MTSSEDQAIIQAAPCASRLSFHLAAAMVAKTPEETRTQLVRVFRFWRALSRDMAALEAVAPNCAEAGYDLDAEGLEIAETVQARARA